MVPMTATARLQRCLVVAVGLIATTTTTITTTHAFVTPQISASSARMLHKLRATSISDAASASASASDTENTSEAASQNVFGLLSDAVTGAAFSLLHAFDPDPIQDSSKNLRVLWVRALLNHRGLIDDPVAATLLPPTTRGLVTTDAGSQLFDNVVQFTEWITARTDFIDAAVEHFLTSPLCTDKQADDGSSTPVECNIVLFGAGYDTRALRFRHKHGGKINFIEVDLPDVTAGKQKLYETFQQEQDPEWDLKNKGPKLIGFDLNEAGGDDPVSLLDVLRKQGGLREGVPTFFVWEAVLFYVNEDAVRNIMQDLFDFCSPAGNKGVESMLCFTDSLKPFVDVPFSNDARAFFDQTANMDLLEHRARWGGAVHFCLASSRRLAAQEEKADKTKAKKEQQYVRGEIGNHVNSRVDGIVNSYMPTSSNNPALLDKPSFDNVWYAVAYPWQIDGYDTPLDAATDKKSTNTKPFATRLWGEPVVIYRDETGQLVAMADVCPHRSAPMSMGTVKDGKLACMYHGWEFGKSGNCVHVPTLQAVDEEEEQHSSAQTIRKRNERFLQAVTKANCGNLRAVVEHEGLVYLWRGNILEADPALLPTRRTGDMETVPIDTVLDYNVDYSYIVENNLDSPHLFYLHDGSVPPIESIGMINKNLPKLKLKFFQDDCGMGHMGRIGAGGRPKKLLRFDPPNIVRHGGVSGFEEEFHIIPVAPQRTRVLLRQHLPRGPILSTITGLPGVLPMLTLLVNNWNYHIGLEDASVMQGQASRIEDWGSPRMSLGGLGDDLIKRFWSWRSEAHKNLEQQSNGTVTSPYFVDFSQNGAGTATAAAAAASASSSASGLGAIPTGTSFGDQPAVVDKVRTDARLRNTPLVMDSQHVDDKTGNPIGSWGIKQAYLQDLPAANFPPVNYKQYASLLVFDEFVKDLFESKEECPPDLVAADAATTTSSSSESSSTLTAAATEEQPLHHQVLNGDHHKKKQVTGDEDAPATFSSLPEQVMTTATVTTTTISESSSSSKTDLHSVRARNSTREEVLI